MACYPCRPLGFGLGTALVFSILVGVLVYCLYRSFSRRTVRVPRERALQGVWIPFQPGRPRMVYNAQQWPQPPPPAYRARDPSGKGARNGKQSLQAGTGGTQKMQVRNGTSRNGKSGAHNTKDGRGKAHGTGRGAVDKKQGHGQAARRTK